MTRDRSPRTTPRDPAWNGEKVETAGIEPAQDSRRTTGVMPGLRERIAEALDVFFVADVTTWNIGELADAVMVEVQRDLDELEARVERKMARLRQAGEVIDAAEADAARLAEALRTLADCPFTAGAEPVDLADYRRVVEVVQAALAAHREREKEASDD